MVLIDGTGEYEAYDKQFDYYIGENEIDSVREFLFEEMKTSSNVEEVKPLVLDFNLFDDDDDLKLEEYDSESKEIPEESFELEEVEVEKIMDDEDIVYYIPDLESVVANLNLTTEDVKTLMKQHKKNIIFVAFNSYLATSYEEGIKYLRSKNKIGMFGVTRNEQKQVPITGYLGNEAYLEANEFYAYQGRKYEKVRIPIEGEL